MSMYALEIHTQAGVCTLNQDLIPNVHICTKHTRNTLRTYLAKPESEIMQDESEAIHAFADKWIAEHVKDAGVGLV